MVPLSGGTGSSLRIAKGCSGERERAGAPLAHARGYDFSAPAVPRRRGMGSGMRDRAARGILCLNAGRMKFPRRLGDFIIRDSAADGRGIFATRDYRAGDFLFAVEGVRIRGSDRRLTHRAIQIGRHWFIEPRRFSLGHYLNHSCAPSAYVEGASLFARSSIRPGEEVTVDYSLFTSHPS